MALTINVTKVSVNTSQEKLYLITLNLRCLDLGVEVINQNFSIKYRPGQYVEEKAKGAIEEMQKVIDNYKVEQLIYNHTKLDQAVVGIEGALVG